MDYNNAYLYKALYNLQKTGDLTLDDTYQEIFQFLQNFNYSLYPILKTETINLSRYFISIYSKFNLDLNDFYDLFNGSILFIYKDILHPGAISGLVSTSLSEYSFTKPLEYLQDYNIIYHYSIDKIYDQYTYPIDYSSFNFSKMKFNLRKEPREHFLDNTYEPKPIDTKDLEIIKEKQLNPKLSLREISKKLGIPVSEALQHLKEHIVPNNIISSYVLTLQKIDFIMLVFFEEKDSIDHISKIPELYLIYQTNSGYLGHIVGQNSSNLLQYLSHISQINLNDQIEFSIIPTDNVKSFSIPVNNFKSGKWEFDLDLMLNKAENIVKNKKFVAN
ncbi:winged helix-turn-helix transcriptional regulator [Acidianus sulfidivorans JP7]|nr:winged helix-turn-helix transcriptional regulator [Acidianus sulfidivorans JP7]